MFFAVYCLSALINFLIAREVGKVYFVRYSHFKVRPIYYSYVAIIYTLPIFVTVFVASQLLYLTLKLENYYYSLVWALFWSVVMMYPRLRKPFDARKHFETIVLYVLFGFSFVAIVIVALIVIALVNDSIQFVKLYPLMNFLFGLKWNLQTNIDGLYEFGFIPLLYGTIMISFLALIIGVGLGTLMGVFLAEYASKSALLVVRPLIEMFAGMPSVVYGFFGALILAPKVQWLGQSLGLKADIESTLAASLMMGILIVPFVCSLVCDALLAVPKHLREASYSLGANKMETITRVVIKAASPALFSTYMLAISRCIGETMIVVMTAGYMANNMTLNPFESLTTITVQIVAIVSGEQDSNSLKTKVAFMLGLTIFCFTLILNQLTLRQLNEYKKKYAFE